MKKILVLLFSIPFLGISQNIVCFTIDPNPNSNDPALAPFTKYVDVLGCFSIYAESTISDAKVLHAAAVAAELLDNNEDGIVDDPLIKAQLISENALMPIFFQDGNSAMNTFDNSYYGNGVSAVLFNDEIDPSQTGHWGDDATVEEVIHTINHVGHTNVYPNAFSLSPNSSLMSDAMDVARGGQFTSIPNPYPASAWYHYDDYTCDYECMAIEYMYWAIVSYMGILDDPQTAAGIANEWEAYNATLLHKAGVVTAINSDDAEMGRRLNQEAAKAIKYGGTTEEEAWKMVTLNPAKLLHLDSHMGSIKEGKDADIVLWSSNPLSVYSRVIQTYVDGKLMFDLERDRKLRKRDLKERMRIIKLMSEDKNSNQKNKPKKIKEKLYHCDTEYDE